MGCGQDAFNVRIGSPEHQRPLVFRVLTEDQTEEHVQTSDSEQEERCDECEVINVMRKDRGPDEALKDPERAEAKASPKDREVVLEEI